MRSRLITAVSAATVFATTPTLAADEPARQPKATEPYPLEYWAMRPVIRNVGVSPDGSRLALLKIPSKDGDPVMPDWGPRPWGWEPDNA